MVQDLARELNRPLYDWSITGGMQRTERNVTATVVDAGKVAQALSYVIDSDEKSIYLFRDLGAHCSDPHIQRLVRDLHVACDRHQSTLIATGIDPLPSTVRRFSVPWDLPWPTVEELSSAVKEKFREIRSQSAQIVTADISKRQLEQLVQSLRGLSLGDAQRVVAMAVHDDFVLDADDLPRIVDAKRTMLGSTGCLEPIAADVAADDIGGFETTQSLAQAAPRWIFQQGAGIRLGHATGNSHAGRTRLRKKPLCKSHCSGLDHAAAPIGSRRVISKIHRRDGKPVAASTATS